MQNRKGRINLLLEFFQPFFFCCDKKQSPFWDERNKLFCWNFHSGLISHLIGQNVTNILLQHFSVVNA